MTLHKKKLIRTLNSKISTIQRIYKNDTLRMFKKGVKDATISGESIMLHLNSQKQHQSRKDSFLAIGKAMIGETKSILRHIQECAVRDKTQQYRYPLSELDEKKAIAKAKQKTVPKIWLKHKIMPIEEEINQLIIKRGALLKAYYDDVPPTQYFYDKSIGYWLTNLAIYSGEIAINYSAIISLNEISNSGALLLAISVSGLMSITAMKAGANFQKRQSTEASLWFIAGITLCAGMMILRLDQSLILSLAIFTFYGISLLLAFAKAKNFDLFQTNRKLKKLAKRLAKLKMAMARLEKKEHLIETTIFSRSKAQNSTQAHLLRNKIDDIERAILHLDSIEKCNEERLNMLCERGISNYARGYKFMSSLLCRKVDPIIFINALTSTNRVDKSQSKFLASKSALIIISLFLMSCTKPIERNITVLIDQTHTHEVKPSDLSNYIFDEIIDFNQNNIRDQVNLNITTIGETSYQNIWRLELAMGDPWIIRRDVERNDEIKEFTSKTDSILYEIMTNQDSLSYSYVHENVANQLNKLSLASEASQRYVIIVSDMLQHTPHFSFYRKQNNFNDFDSFQKTMRDHIEIKDCKGIDIQIIHLPNKNTDFLFSSALKFWVRMYKNYGANVEHISGLQK